MDELQIKDRYTGEVIFAGKYASIKEAAIVAAESGANLHWADLSGADLHMANLYRTNLSEADLHMANLSGANLSWADLRMANLYRTNLSEADLHMANLHRANLSGADLRMANLHRANLSEADLHMANLSEADLSGAALPPLSILPQGTLIGWKILQGGIIAKLEIPTNANRVNSTGRKCRAEYALVIDLGGATEGRSQWASSFIYKVGEIVRPVLAYNPDFRVECASGIHFFITREEAEANI